MQFARATCLPTLAAALVLAAPVAGCGSSERSGYGSRDSTEEPTATATTPAAPPGASARTCEGTVAGTEQLRVTGIGCDVGRRVVAAWDDKAACSSPGGASRYSCTVHDDYRCLAAATEAGIAVSCSHPGSSIAFVAKRG